MKTILKIAWAELRVLFYSPIAWFLMVAYLIQCAAVYMMGVKAYVGLQEIGGEQLRNLEFLTSHLFASEGGLLPEAMQQLYLYIPLLTMGLISRELSSGTIKLLYSSPVTVRKIVLGKYLAMMIIGLAMMALTGIFLVSGLFQVQHADKGVLLSGALALYLLICAYAAIGLFMSALTTYQVVAAVCTFIVIGALTYVGTLWQDIGFVRDITYFLSLKGRASRMLSGLITTKDVVYFLVIIYLFIGLTITRLQLARRSAPFFKRLLRYGLVLVSGLAIGYVSARPACTGYLDLTQQQQQTLTPNARSTVQELAGAPLHITVYNNLLSRNAWMGMPAQRNQFLARWDFYQRYKPDIDFDFVQYYDTPLDMPFAAYYPGKTLEQAAAQVAAGHHVSLGAFMKPAEIHKIIDLQPEFNRLVMQLKWRDKSTFLRVYDDPAAFPTETEVAAAFKRLRQSHLPRIAFVTGHLERDIGKTGPREYHVLTHMPAYRFSLVNQGFDTDTLHLDTQDIPADIDALVIADPKTALSPIAGARLQHYIDQGGNLLLAGEPGKQPVLNPLLQKIGVRLMDGMIVNAGHDYAPDVVNAVVTPAAARFTRSFAAALEADSLGVVLNGSVGLQYDTTAGFRVIPLLVTNAATNWLRKAPLAPDSTDIGFDPARGDMRGPFPVAIGLTRQVAGHEQRIVVMGDADFMSNASLQMAEPPNINFPFNTALFSWLDNGAFPIDTWRPRSIDNRIHVSIYSLRTLNWIYGWIVPGVIAVFAAVLLIRRKRK
ncbi:MAG TPA: Gldg family protein [Chitinophaga sp.]